MAKFASDASIVLDATGPDLNSFIETLGWRLYDETFEHIKQSLTASNHSDRLAEVLQERYNRDLGSSWSIEGPGGARWVAKAMTLSLAPEKKVRGL